MADPGAEERADGTAPDNSDAPPPEPPPTPFNHPLFLPALLLAGCVWFGYDGFLNSDPEMLEHQTFNRVGFAILVVLTGWFGYQGLGDFREMRDSDESSQPD